MTSSKNIIRLVELTSNVANAFTAALFLAHPKDRKLVMSDYHSLSHAIHPRTVLAFGEGPIGQVAATGEAVLQENFTGGSAQLKMYSRPEELKGFMALPVKTDRLWGVLALDTKESYSFSLRMQKIIAGFADLIAAQLAGEAELGPEDDENLPSRELIRYTQSIADSLHPAAMAEQLTRIPRRILHYDAMAVVWMDEEQDRGRVVHHVGWEQDLAHWEVIPGKGLAGSTLKNGMPILIPQVNDNRTVLFKEGETLEGFQSLLSSPILFKGHTLAVLICASRKKNDYSGVHLDRLNMLGTFAAPALFYAREKRQWDYDKNLDQVTGVPNHRCLVAYRENIEKEVLKGHKTIFFLSIHLKNLLGLYEKQGVVMGDQLQKQVVSMLSKVVPSPKFLFKYSDSSFLVILLKMQRQDVDVLEMKLRHVFDKTPFFVEGRSLSIEAEMGLAAFPEDGQNLCELAGLSWARSSQPLNETHDQKLV